MITKYFGNKVLNALVGKLQSISLGTVYVGLSTTTPAQDGTNVTEPTGNGYVRVMLGTSTQSATQKMSEAKELTTSNSEIIYFPEATGAWGTITHVCLYDAQTNGNLLAYSALESSISPEANQVPLVRVGEITISLA